MIIIIDNYDSFTYNLVQYVQALHSEVCVVRNDTTTCSAIRSMQPKLIILSPGPGRPRDAGISCALVQEVQGVIPLFGVCLGMQCIGEVSGGTTIYAPQLMHGKASWVFHRETPLFAGLPQPFHAGRYHSLAVDPRNLHQDMAVTAETIDGTVMALERNNMFMWGVQFHPESVLTPCGLQLIGNVLHICGLTRS